MPEFIHICSILHPNKSENQREPFECSECGKPVGIGSTICRDCFYKNHKKGHGKHN